MMPFAAQARKITCPTSAQSALLEETDLACRGNQTSGITLGSVALKGAGIAAPQGLPAAEFRPGSQVLSAERTRRAEAQLARTESEVSRIERSIATATSRQQVASDLANARKALSDARRASRGTRDSQRLLALERTVEKLSRDALATEHQLDAVETAQAMFEAIRQVDRLARMSLGVAASGRHAAVSNSPLAGPGAANAGRLGQNSRKNGLGRVAAQGFQSFVSRFDTQHILSYEVNGKNQLSGGHHLPELAPNMEMRSFSVDVRTGHAVVDLRVDGVKGKQGGLHTMFNPAWSQLQVLEVIDFAFQNQIRPPQPLGSGATRWWGRDASGTEIAGICNANGTIRTAFPIVT